MKSEFDLIARMRRQAMRQFADLTCGIGDDTAVISERTGRETLITADLLIEEVHFRTEYTPLHHLGHKALAVSLSDIAAMGGQPRFSLLTLGIPGSSDIRQKWDEFSAGYHALADACGVVLIGGDTSASPDRLVIDSIVMGHCAQGRAIRRQGARVGDAIYVTGEIGASAAGLELLRRGERINRQGDDAVEQALRAHLLPQPRVEFGHRVGKAELAHAMIDVSDGLAQDLRHICAESGVGAILDSDAVPVAAATRLVNDDDDGAFYFAISGGEDYELLLTAERENENALVEAAQACRLRLTRIGEIVAADPAVYPASLLLRRAGRLEPMSASGYDHFV